MSSKVEPPSNGKCLSFFNLKVCSTIGLGIVLAFDFVSIYQCVQYLLGEDKSAQDNLFSYAIIFHLSNATLTCTAMVGTLNLKWELLLPWLVFSVLDAVILATTIIITASRKHYMVLTGAVIMSIVILVVYLVIWSLFRKLRRDERSVKARTIIPDVAVMSGER